MRYGQIRKYDVANGPGIRTSVFVTGCTHHCPQCFNEEYQDFQAGTLWTQKETETLLSYLALPEVEGLTLLGGEPFQNTDGLIPLVKSIRQHSQKSIWIYSGYTWEQILSQPEQYELLRHCDVLVDGLFIAAQKDLRLRFRGSANQRIIDIAASLNNNSPVLLEEFMK